MIREELGRLTTWEERHRTLLARIVLAFTLTLIVDAIGTLLIYASERDVQGGAIHTFGNALFFTTVQLLTVSSQMANPLTVAGRIVDVVLEIWALFVVTALAGSFASFFGNADSG